MASARPLTWAGYSRRPDPGVPVYPRPDGRPRDAGRLGGVPRPVCRLAGAASGRRLGNRRQLEGRAGRATVAAWPVLRCCSTSPGRSTRYATSSAPAPTPPAAMTAPPTCGRWHWSRSAKAGTTAITPTLLAPGMELAPVRSHLRHRHPLLRAPRLGHRRALARPGPPRRPPPPRRPGPAPARPPACRTLTWAAYGSARRRHCPPPASGSGEPHGPRSAPRRRTGPLPRGPALAAAPWGPAPAAAPCSSHPPPAPTARKVLRTAARRSSSRPRSGSPCRMSRPTEARDQHSCDDLAVRPARGTVAAASMVAYRVSRSRSPGCRGRNPRR